jgi:hypothetical protein
MFSQIYLDKLINKDKYDRGELLCLSLINVDDISHAQTQLIPNCEFSPEYAKIQGLRNSGGRGAMAAPLFQWIIINYQIKSSLPAWNGSRAILPRHPPPPRTSKQAPGPCNTYYRLF